MLFRKTETQNPSPHLSVPNGQQHPYVERFVLIWKTVVGSNANSAPRLMPIGRLCYIDATGCAIGTHQNKRNQITSHTKIKLGNPFVVMWPFEMEGFTNPDVAINWTYQPKAVEQRIFACHCNSFFIGIAEPSLRPALFVKTSGADIYQMCRSKNSLKPSKDKVPANAIKNFGYSIELIE